MTRTPVLRVLYQFGPERLLRASALAVWLGALLLQPMIWRPDLLHPTDIGSDSSNYAAAAQRVAAGHDLYTLIEGDRPAPLDNPPEWTVPILSPPAIGVANLWQVALPEGVGMYIGWAAGIAAMAVLGQVVILAARPVIVLLLVYWIPSLAVTAWSGNVNALIAPGAMLVWWASQQEQRRWQVLAGVIVAIAACVKIGPLFLGIWLVAQRRWYALIACVAAGVVIVTATILISGTNALFDYVAIARSAVAEPTSLSIPGILRDLNASEQVQAIALPAAMLVAVALMFYWRGSPISFTLAALAMIFSTPIVRHETAALAIVVAVAWLPSSSRHSLGTAAPTRAMILPSIVVATSMAIVIVLVSLVTGGTDRSTFAMANRTSEPVVVRFSLYIQRAQFGFLVPGGQSVYGWLDRSGASPPLATVWSTSCDLLDVVELPRTGAILEYRGAGAQSVSELPDALTFAPYVPDCFVNLVQYLEEENPHVRSSSTAPAILESSSRYYRSVAIRNHLVDRPNVDQ